MFLTVSDVIFLLILMIYITKITTSHYDKVIHDLPTTPWSHKHADPDVCRKIFPCGREKLFHLKNANGSERSRFFCPIRGLARSAVRHRDSSLGYPRSRSITLCHISCITALDDARSATCPPREALCRDVDVSTKSTSRCTKCTLDTDKI